MIKKYRKNKLKGSVLYTVVAVMMIMTVFVFAALTLASAANRRAFNSYANNQTQYTARSVVDSMMKILRENGSAAVGELTPDELNILNNSIDSSMGKVTSAKIESIGTIKELEAKNYNFGLNLTEEQKNNYVYKLSATVKMLGQENTVSLYCYNGKEDNPPVFNHSLTVLGDLIMDDKANTFGDVYSFVENPGDVYLLNSAKMDSSYGNNGSITLRGNNKWSVPEAGLGIFINGNMTFDGQVSNFTSDITQSGLLYRDLPYLFVRDKIDLSDKISIGDFNHPYIVMTDSINTYNYQNKFYGDVYLYDQATTSVINSNFLFGCSSNVFKKKNNNNLGYNAYMGGNLYSMGSVNVIGSGTLANNVLIDNTLTFNANNNTTGAVVAENINLNGGDAFNFANGLFVDPDKLTLNYYNIYINEQKYSNEDYTTQWQTVTEYGERQLTNSTSEIVKTHYNNRLNYDCPFSDFLINDAARISAQPTSINIQFSKIDDFLSQKLKVDCYFYYIDNYNNRQFASKKEGYIDTSGDLKFTANLSDISPVKSETGFISVGISIYPEYDYSIYDEAQRNYIHDEDMFKEIKIENITVNFSIAGEKSVFIPNQKTPLALIRAANDVSFNNNDNIIYIDDIDKSVKIKRLVDEYGTPVSMEISTADLTGIEEGNETSVSYSPVEWTDYSGSIRTDFSYDSEYAEFLRTVVNTVTFPESMKKTNVIDNGSNSKGFVDTSFLSSTILENIKKNSKSYEDVKSYIEDKPVYMAGSADAPISVYEKAVEKKSVSIDDLEINCNCTLSGNFQFNNAKILKINPGDNDMYINLINFTATNLTIKVDDSGSGKVTFIVPRKGIIFNYSFIDSYGAEQNPTIVSEGNVNFNKSSLLTTTYYVELNKSSSEIWRQPADTKYVPNIYFYMDDSGSYDDNGTIYNDNDDTGLFNITNGSTISAYINAPTAKLKKGGTYKTYNIKYNGISESLDIGIIGSAIFNKVSLSNPFAFLYVDENGASLGAPDPSDVGEFTTLYYQSY